MNGGFVYLDSSVVLAQILLEDVRPPAGLWNRNLISSRLVDYESWVRINRQGLSESHGEALTHILAGIAKLELIEPVVYALREGLPGALRTLDALHLASVQFLMEEGQRVQVATYDRRLASAVEAAGIELYPL